MKYVKGKKIKEAQEAIKNMVKEYESEVFVSELLDITKKTIDGLQNNKYRKIRETTYEKIVKPDGLAIYLKAEKMLEKKYRVIESDHIEGIKMLQFVIDKLPTEVICSHIKVSESTLNRIIDGTTKRMKTETFNYIEKLYETYWESKEPFLDFSIPEMNQNIAEKQKRENRVKKILEAGAVIIGVIIALSIFLFFAIGNN